MTKRDLPWESALAHAGVLIERLVFRSRNLGLLPRTTTDDDPLGSMCVNDEEVGTMLAALRQTEAAEDPLAARATASRAALRQNLADPSIAGYGLPALARCFAPGDAALDTLVLALAPDWDARLGRLFGFLNNDLSRLRPTVAQFQLLGIDPLTALPALVTMERGLAPLAARAVVATEHVVRLSRSQLPAPAAAPSWDELHFAAGAKAELQSTLTRELGRVGDDRRLLLVEGLPGSGRRSVTLAAAAELGRSAVTLSLKHETEESGAVAIAESALAARLLDGIVVVRADGAAGARLAATQLARHLERLEIGAVLLVRPGALDGEDDELRFTRLTVVKPGARERRAILGAALDREGVALGAGALEEVAGRYELTPGRLAEVAHEVALRRANPTAGADTALVAAALRDITNQKLTQLATRHAGHETIDDLVLPADVKDRLGELVSRLQQRYRVMHEWGFGGEARRGVGVTALFSGPSGTGKTAAAAAVARALELDLYVVDLARVLSKWVGETEQNLARVFDHAEASGVTLLFDEADSLFAKRTSDIRSATDRYANVTVSYLLQRIESYGGLCILTTNLESAIDDAFSRRLTCRLEFSKPTEEERLEIWHRLLPKNASYAADVDWDLLVRSFDFTGARIRNALARAAYLVARRESGERVVLCNEDLVQASRMEFEDMGRVVSGPRHPIATRAVAIR